MTRDPRIDPQPGDEISAGGVIRRVLKREGSKVLTATGFFQSWMRVDRWQKWCKQSGPEVAKAANQEE
jgi:hypothetical protein